MKIIISFFLILFSASTCLQAQEFTAGYSLGYGSCQMKDMKETQKKALKAGQSLYPGLKSTETFPGGLFQDAYIGVKFSLHELGASYSYYSTGGRIHLADYSGEIKSDLLLSGNAIGLYYKFHYLSLPVSKDIRFGSSVGFGFGAIKNELKSEELYEIYGQNINNSFTEYGHSTNWYLKPNLGCQFIFKNFILLNLNAGYEFDMEGNIKGGDEESYRGVDWSGCKLSAGLGFKFSAINK